MSKLTTIKTYNNRAEAEANKGLLQSNNIKSIVSADDCGGACPDMALTGVQLLINVKDFEEATKILNINSKFSNTPDNSE